MLTNPGETNLPALLQGMKAELKPGLFAFVSFSEPSAWDRNHLNPVLTFKEVEGETMILALDDAAHAKIPYSYPCRWITLNIHSSLEAVGLLAAVTGCLAKAGISVNAVSAYYHDHLFVSPGKAEETMQILEGLSSGN